MWKRLRERFHVVKVRVLHTLILKSSSVVILRSEANNFKFSESLAPNKLIH